MLARKDSPRGSRRSQGLAGSLNHQGQPTPSLASADTDDPADVKMHSIASGRLHCASEEIGANEEASLPKRRPPPNASMGEQARLARSSRGPAQKLLAQNQHHLAPSC